ncbi:unnamed protein product [Rhizophagus irregularis]|nr:unnamed protein product [Rhizophagus irregularis]
MDIPRRHYRVYDQELSKVVLDQQAFIIPADRLSRFMVLVTLLKRLNQITEVVRFITENDDYIIKGNWFCQHWRCKHEPKCKNERECRNRCPHEPECQTEEQCRTLWVCKHEPICEFREQCQRRWSCRHNPMCQNKWFCRKNWRCMHPSRCKDIWECKYRWTEEYEPHCQGRWQCYHRQKCRTKLQCQNKSFQTEWKCQHEAKCYNKWKCQSRWQCQHKKKCEMTNSKKSKCQAKCQHQCKNEEECLKKSHQDENEKERLKKLNKFETKWKCQHQCENLRECKEKWKCSHENEPKCKDEWKCRSRGWRCQHSPPCEGSCQDKWDRENEWNCNHAKECQTNWQCLNDPQYKNKWQCLNKWTIGYSQNELKAILEKSHQQLYNFFSQQCKECGKNCIISSFILYKRSTTMFLEREIICHLVWAKAKKTRGDVFYRVFGSWKCDENHSWDSSYTWISLRKFVENQARLSDRDYWKIKCHECRSDGNISSWQIIVGSKDGPLHERELCEKCRSGEVCVQTNSYFG